MIKLSSVSKSFPTGAGRLLVLAGISMGLAEGERVAVLGPSGCGKTTLLRLIAGLEKADAGDLTISKGSQQPNVLEMVFQQPALLPWRTALENVLLPIELANSVSAARSQTGLPLKAKDLLTKMGLKDFAHYYPHQLSGGMRSRVSIARALVMYPEVLLLDEPFSTLDEVTRAGLQDMLMEIALELCLTLVFVTHSVEEAVVVADRVLVLSQRPATIIADIRVELPRVCTQRRDSKAALELRAKLRGVLTDNARLSEAKK